MAFIGFHGIFMTFIGFHGIFMTFIGFHRIFMGLNGILDEFSWGVHGKFNLPAR